jgi:formamidopyrimidine-DNA glycosylase
VPELPEVETTRRGLAPHLTGRRIQKVLIYEPRLRWRVAASLAPTLEGQRIHAVERRAKYLLLRLDHGTVIWHLGMSGSLRVLPADTPRLKHDHIDVLLDSGKLLRFNDPRRFGCCIYTATAPDEHKLLRTLAPEPFDAAFDADYLQRVTRKRRVAIKQLLLNGQLITGVGNIYASEALFRARIRPGRAAQSLKRNECGKLLRAIKAVLAQAIRAGGTSLRDYVNPEGDAGHFKQKLYVYERDGLPCRVCKSPIKHLIHGQRSTYYCAQCQH